MKLKILSIVFIFALFACPMGSFAQYRLADYEGIWRWTSGSGDTLLLVLKQIPVQGKLTGFHAFSQRGVVLDNSIPGTPNRTFDSATIYAHIIDPAAGQLQYVIQDHLRNSIYIGKIDLLTNNRDKAIFYTTKTERSHLFYDPNIPLSAGRTFPDNLVLVRIE